MVDAAKPKLQVARGSLGLFVAGEKGNKTRMATELKMGKS
jgi:hypothetical protein